MIDRLFLRSSEMVVFREAAAAEGGDGVAGQPDRGAVKNPKKVGTRRASSRQWKETAFHLT